MGESGATGKGGRGFSLKIPEGGGEGAGRVFAGNFWGGGLIFFFRGRNVHQVGQGPPNPQIKHILSSSAARRANGSNKVEV